jgi:Bax protein
MKIKKTFLAALLAASAVFFVSSAKSRVDLRDELFECDKTVEYSKAQEILKKSDLRNIPRFPLKNVPLINLASKTDRDVFIKAIASTVGKANEFIKEQREFIIFVREKSRLLAKLTKHEIERLEKIRRFYQTRDFSELLLRVAPVPVSLAVAQAALESRFGSEPFICRHNAYFGLQKSRTSLIKFDTLFNSVIAYAKTLNVNERYKKFRQQRSLMMEKTNKIDATTLVHSLENYGTDKNYAKLLLKFIRLHDLATLD